MLNHMKLPFQKAKLVSAQQFYLVHVKSKTLSILGSPPAFSWIKVVGCLCKRPPPTSSPTPASAQGTQRYLQPLRWSRNPANTVSPAAERAAGAAQTLPSRRGLPRPAVLPPLQPQGRTAGWEAAGRARLAQGWTPAAWPQCREPASPILSGRNRFAVIGA